MSVLTSTIAALANALPGGRASRLLILIYHRVHPCPDPMYPAEVDAERFDWQMSLLQQHCHPLPLSDAVEGLKVGRLPPRAVAVTFDDGYADNATIALPILQRYAISATFFIAAGFLDGGRMWNDSIIEAIRRASQKEIDLIDLGLGVLPLNGYTSRILAAEAIIKVVKHLPFVEREARVTALCDQIGAFLPTDLMMTPDRVRQLAEAGMEIGAHTVTHPILRTLCDQAAAEEIQGSRRLLEEITGKPIRAFAYPNGQPSYDYTRRDRDLVAGMGFTYAVCTCRDVATQQSDLFQLPRFTPWDREPSKWLARLLLSFNRLG